MPNVDNNNYIGGGLLNGKNPFIETFVIGTADSTALGLGAFVKPGGSAATYSGNGQVYPTVAKATTADAILGRLVGVEPITDESTIYRAASTERLLYIDTDPDQSFAIQVDGAFAVADVGLNANIVTGSAVGALGRQQEEIAVSTLATTSTLQLKVTGVVQEATNEVGSYAKVIAKINNHARQNNQTAGV